MVVQGNLAQCKWLITVLQVGNTNPFYCTRVYTFVNVFIDIILIIIQYKSHRSGQIVHTRPLMKCMEKTCIQLLFFFKGQKCLPLTDRNMSKLSALSEMSTAGVSDSFVPHSFWISGLTLEPIIYFSLATSEVT